jgi:hypothetical protein
MLIWVGNAFSYTINDTTNVTSYYAQTEAAYAWGGTTTHDVIGSPPIFNVWGIDVTNSSGNLTFDLYTNFNHDGYYALHFGGTPGWDIHAFVADLAIDVNPAAEDGYEYGVVMRDHGTWTVGADPGNDYEIGLYQVDGWNTSSHFFHSTVGDGNELAIYGGGYTVGGTEQAPPVAISSAIGDKVANVVASTTAIDYDGPPSLPPGLPGSVITPVDFGDGYSAPKYRWSFTINNFNTTLGLAPDEEFGIFWGGATCGNDIISGTTNENFVPPPIPEPATLFLTGFGLIGLAVIGRSKSRRRFRRK